MTDKLPTYNSMPALTPRVPTVSNYDKQQARIEKLEEALTALMELNDNHSPFGGEMYWDRVERIWDAARAALKETP
jgi:hypothetical protein